LRVAVLGSNSFAGCDFVDLLLGNGRDDVLGISRSPEKPEAFLAYGKRRRDRFVYRQLDLNRNFEGIRTALDAFRPQFIVNFAAQAELAASWTHPQDFFQTNCVALAGLIDYLKDQSDLQRFLQVSTSSVYSSSALARTEEAPVDPGTPYGVSKAAIDHLLLAYHKNFGFPSQIVRPPNLYGPYQQIFRIIPRSMILLKRGRRIDLHGGGYASRQYLNIRDASRAVLSILECGGPGQIYNIAPDEASSIRDIVAAICERLGKDFDACTREVGDRRGHQSGLQIDSTKIRRELGWHPQISLRTGIEGVLDWIERDWDDLVEQPLVYTHKP
jgi:dTDP-glucose 4,6-dehydratase